MAIVSDIQWICPGCGSVEVAQVLGWHEDLTPDAIPTECGGLRWNPPCESCGKFRLVMPPTIACMPQRIPEAEI